MACVVKRFQLDLPQIVDEILRLGGLPISIVHTELIALLPPDQDTFDAVQMQLASIVRTDSSERQEAEPRATLARGLVDMRHVATATPPITLLSGPTLDAVRSSMLDIAGADAGGAEPTTVDVMEAESPSSAETAQRATPFAAGQDETTPNAGNDTRSVAAGSLWNGDLVTTALCSVAFDWDDRTIKRSARIVQTAREFDGDVHSVTARGNAVELVALFPLPASSVRDAAARSELRAADFALLVREQHGEEVRCAISAGQCLDGILDIGSRTLRAVAGEPRVRVTDLLEHVQPGCIVMNGATAERLSTEYAVQPIGGTTRGGKRIPTGTTLLLWRAFPNVHDGSLVGREHELSEIYAYLASDSCESLHVAGPPGIGKTALVAQVLRTRPASAVLKVAGSDAPEGPFASVIDGVREYWDLPPQDAPNYAAYVTDRLTATGDRIWDEDLRAEFEELRHFIAHAFGVTSPVAAALEPEARYGGVKSGLIALLKALQSLRILWIDDRQWLDAADLEVLASWVESREPERLRVVTTVRTPTDHPADGPQNEISGVQRSGREIHLTGLAASASHALLSKRGPIEHIPQKDIDTIVAQCRGNPFFLEQSIRFLEDEMAAGNTPTIPDSVQTVIMARIKRLSREVREAVEMAAVLGLRFDMRILSAMLREEKLPASLQKAQREGFWNSIDELNTIFCHALIRDTVYDAQFVERRTELHAAAVRAFEAVYTGETRRSHLYQLAEHCELAGHLDEALIYLAEAAEYAFEQFENERAVALLRKRLSLTGRSERRAVLDLSRALIRTAAWNEAAGLLRDVVAAGAPSTPVAAVHAFADCCYSYADLLIEQGDLTRAREVTAEGLSALATEEYHHGAAMLRRSLGQACFRENDYEGAVHEYSTGLEHARLSGDSKTVARLTNALAIVHVRTGKYEEAQAAFESTLALARDLNDIQGISSALNNLGYLYDNTGEFEHAISYFREDLSLCAEAGLREGRAIATGNIGDCLASLGRHEEAVSHFQEAIEIDSQIGFLPHRAYNLQQLGHSLMTLGNHSEGCKRLSEAAELAARVNLTMVQEESAELLDGCREET
jgi:tetratricopeptide (TPR) repeat protein